jgi:hypothetical protein
MTPARHTGAANPSLMVIGLPDGKFTIGGWKRIMMTAGEYRRRAAECVKLADAVGTDELRDGFLQMAREWNQKALIAEGRLQPSIEMRPVLNSNPPAVAPTGQPRTHEVSGETSSAQRS